MKILIDLSGFSPGRAFGATTFVENMLIETDTYLDNHSDFTVIVLCSRKTQEHFSGFKNIYFFVKKIPENSFIRVLKLGIYFKKYEKEINPDVVFFPLNIAYASKNKSVLYLHDLVSKYYLENFRGYEFLRNFLLWFLIKNSIHSVSKILCPSLFIREQIIEKGKGEADIVQVLHEGIPVKEPTSFPLDIEKDRKVIFIPSYRAKHKNIHLFVEALRILESDSRGALNNLCILITGKENAVTKQIEEELQNINSEIQVKITGFLQASEVCYLYLVSDIIVYCTRYEGFGLPMLEAATYQTPILCSDISPLRELCSPYSFYFTNNSAEELSGLIKRGIEEGLEPKYSAFDLSSYSWTNFVDKLFEVFANHSND